MTAEPTATISFPLGGTIGERVRLARTAAGLSCKEMGRAIGVSLKTYQRIEQNKRDLRLAELNALAAVTGQSEKFFFGASPVAEPPTLPLLPGAVKQDNGEEHAA